MTRYFFQIFILAAPCIKYAYHIPEYFSMLLGSERHLTLEGAILFLRFLSFSFSPVEIAGVG
jgi:hypothetical protein